MKLSVSLQVCIADKRGERSDCCWALRCTIYLHLHCSEISGEEKVHAGDDGPRGGLQQGPGEGHCQGTRQHGNVQVRMKSVVQMVKFIKFQLSIVIIKAIQKGQN